MEHELSFGAVVKARRMAMGLTQAELGRRVGCAPITIRKIEAGALRPSVQVAEQLAVALHIREASHVAFVRLARAIREPVSVVRLLARAMRRLSCHAPDARRCVESQDRGPTPRPAAGPSHHRGRWVVTGSVDLLHADNADLVRYACSQLGADLSDAERLRYQLGAVYHSDAQTHGPSADEHGKNAHVQLFYDFLPPP